MPKKPTLNVCLIGQKFMGRTHSNAYLKVGKFFDLPVEPAMHTISGRDAAELSAFADKWGWKHATTDWRSAVTNPDIHLVDIGVPNDRHMEMALAALEAGKHVACEKPLAHNLDHARAMRDAAKRARKCRTFVWYNYRRVPAVTLAQHLIAQGKLGRIFHYRAKFLQDWTINPELPQGGAGLWRLDVAAAGSGVSGDLLAHCIDTALWLNGPLVSINALTETFVKQRKHTLTGQVEPVGIDDACLFIGRFANGSLANFESTRYARGHKALYTFEINGEHASIAWDLHDLHRLQYFDHRDEGIVRGWRSIHVTDGDHPYMGKWWVPGLQIGYEHSFIHQVADFIAGVESGQPAMPTFRDALRTQMVLDAILQSAKTHAWAEVPMVEG